MSITFTKETTQWQQIVISLPSLPLAGENLLTNIMASGLHFVIWRSFLYIRRESEASFSQLQALIPSFRHIKLNTVDGRPAIFR